MVATTFIHYRVKREQTHLILYAQSSICLVNVLRDSTENINSIVSYKGKREQIGRTFLNDKMSEVSGGNSSHKMYSSLGNRRRYKQMGYISRIGSCTDSCFLIYDFSDSPGYSGPLCLIILNILHISDAHNIMTKYKYNLSK